MDRPGDGTLDDDEGEALQSCSTQFRNYGGRTAFEGEITTITVFEDNIIVKSAITENGVGRVLVVDGAGSLCCALMGDWMADRAASNGWAGVVINGAVRDVEALSRIDLGVKRLGSNPRRSGKDDSGGGMSEVTFGA